MAEECSLCPESLFHSDTIEPELFQKECHELFHNDCPKCSLANKQDESMCDVCRHLRLRHLVTCIEPGRRQDIWLHLQEGLAEPSAVIACPLCRMTSHLMMIHLNQDQISELRRTRHDIFLWLASNSAGEVEASTGLMGELCVNLSSGGSMTNWRIGDLHIADVDKGRIHPRFL